MKINAFNLKSKYLYIKFFNEKKSSSVFVCQIKFMS